MPRKLIPIVATKHGLHDANAFAEQPPTTTSLSQNVRTQQAATGRLRIGSRNGYKRFNSRTLAKNFLAFTEDFGHFRDRFEGDRPFPIDEGWIVGVTGAGSCSATRDGTFGPDGASLAQLVKQLLATGSNRLEVGQTFDPTDPSTTALAKAGATWVRTASKDILLSTYMKASDAGASLIALRQGTSAGFPRTQLTITWTAGVPSTVLVTDGAGNHPSGFTDEGNGWYRFWVGITWSVGSEPSAPTLRCLLLPNSLDTTVKGTYFWGAQVELVPSATTTPTRYDPVLGKNDSRGSRKPAALLAVNHLVHTHEYKRKPAQLATRTSASTPEKQSPQAVVYDRQKNRYVLEPQAVVKYSATGTLVFSIPIPIGDPAHVCQALHVDETDQIYVGVSSGGDSAQAKLFCFRQGPEVVSGRLREDSFHLWWAVETKQYVVSIDSLDGVLSTLQDDPLRRLSELVTYVALDLAEPDEGLRRPTPYPSAGMKVKTDGSVVSCHGTNATRGLDPSANGSDTLGPWPTAVGWTPQNDLLNWGERIWCALDAEFINGAVLPKTSIAYKDRDEVTEWVDISGKNRNAYKVIGIASRNPPVVNLKGISGIPSVRFERANTHVLVSNPNPGTDETNRDLHRSIFPAYDGAVFTAFVVYRPTYETSQGAVLGQAAINDTSPANDQDLVLCSNRAMSGSVAAPSRGRCSLFNHADTADPATGTGAHPTDHLLESGGLVNFCVATIKVGPNANESVLRFNGTQVEGPYQSKALNGTGATGLGYYERDAAFGFFDGEIFAIYVYNELLSSTDIELHEGYFANRYGGQGRLDATHPYKITPGIGLQVPSAAPIPTGKANVNLLNHRSTILAKFAPGGELKWTVTDYSGVGFDVGLDASGSIYSFGEFDNVESGDYLPANRGRKGWLRKVLDLGDTANPDDVVADWCQNKCRSAAASVSHDFSNAFWAKTDVTIASNSTTDPFGASQADTLTDGVAGGAGTVIHDFVTADLFDGSDFTFSVYLKTSTASSVRVAIRQQGGTGFTQLDLVYATRAATPTFGGAGHRHRFDIEDVGNGWLRLEVSIDFKASDSGTLRIEIVPDITGATLASFAYGAMLERNPYASTFAYDGIQQKHFEPPSSLGSLLPRLAVDSFGNVFLPGPWPTPTVTPESKTLFSMRIYDKDLYLIADLDVGRLSTNDFRPGRAVAVNGEPPVYTESNPGIARNLLGFTERFDNAYWTKTSVTVTPSSRFAPDRTPSADTVDDSSATVEGTLTRDVLAEDLDTGEDYTFSVHLSPQDATTSRIALEHTAGVQSTSLLITWNAISSRAPTMILTSIGTGTHTYELVPLANGFFRFSVTVTYDATKGGLRVRVNPDGTAANTGAVTAWGAQLERAKRMSPYQRVDGQWTFAPPPLTGQVDPVALSDYCTLVTSNNDVEDASTAPLATVHEIDLVEKRPVGVAARDTKLVTAIRGSLYVIDRFGEPQVVRGASSALEQNARYTSFATIYQRLIATDGKQSVIYEPHVDGQVRPYVAKSGEVPAGVKLWAAYRGRAICARTEDDGHAWFASAIEDIFDWDYFTPPLRADKAVFSTTSRAGLAPDIINALIPYEDQQLIAGCDHSIWYLPGDPLGANAEWQTLSTKVGIAFGDKTSCVDKKGNLFFFASRGGLNIITPRGTPRSLTTERIERRLADIDLEKFYVELQWNWRAEGIEIFVLPYGQPAAVVKHFFYGLRFDEWREDEWATALVQPTTSAVLDGDEPRDRRLVVLNGNLNALLWDENETTDDGLLIASKELIGPYDVGGDSEARWNEPTFVMSEDTTGARFELYAADSADAIGPIRATGLLGPGRNARALARTRGAKFWVLVGSSVLGQKWALEEAGVWGARAGRARVR
jgi:hypothetical protein